MTPKPGAVSWLTNLTLVDVETGARLTGRSVELTGAVITRVTSSPPPPTAYVVDLGGRFLLPGLLTCHTHLSVVFPFADTDEAEPVELTVLRAAQRARDALQAGFTTLRCVHEQNRADLVLRDASRRGFLAAPRIFGAGRALSTPAGHGAGSGCSYAQGPDEFYAAALAEIAAGADHVKIFINGGLARSGEDFETPEMTPEEVAATVRAAGEHDAYVVAHSGGSQEIRAAALQGVRSFEHAYELDAPTAALLAERGAFLTPTLCVTRSEPWMRANDFAEASIANARAAADSHLASIRRAIAAGVQIVNGTDIPPGDLVAGRPAAVHEVLLLEDAGLSRLAALQSVTTTAARLLGAEGRLGRVAPGHAADLVALPGDPLDDLAALAEVDLVVSAGTIVKDRR